MLTSLFTIKPNRRRAFVRQVVEYAKPDKEFYILTGLSALIVTLGLAIDSGPVVIGAMLIAPLFWPIMSISLSVVTGSVRRFQEALISLGKAILLVVLLAFIVGLFSPLSQNPGQEILSRVDPNLIHLFIALLSGATGAFALIWPRLSSSLAGVLIATAFLPPLGVVGYSLASANLPAASGALLLFLTNLIVILFVSTVMLLVFGFRPSSESQEKKALLTQDLRWSVILILLLAVPLTYSLMATARQDRHERAAERTTLEYFDFLTEGDIDALSVRTTGGSTEVQIELQSAQPISKQNIVELEGALTRAIASPIDLSVTVIDVQRFTE